MESSVKISFLFISVESAIVGVEYRNGNEREPSLFFFTKSVESSIEGVENSLVQSILLLVRAIDDVSVLELFGWLGNILLLTRKLFKQQNASFN